MRAALALLAAVLLVLSMAAVVAEDGSSGTRADSLAVARSSHDSIAILTLDSPSRAARTSGSLDVGTALSLDRAAAGIRLERYAFEERLANSEDPGDVVTAALNEIQNRSAALLRAERALWRGYANGSIDETAFRRGLARHHIKAEALERWQDRLGELRGEPFLQHPVLTALTGPVRSRITEAIRGRNTGTVYVESSPAGVVLATIHHGVYVRETYRADRQSIPPEPIQIDRLEDLPSLSRRYGLSQIPNIQGYEGQTFFRYTFGFDFGSITAYLDGGTVEVFYEVQTRELVELPPRPSVRTVENGTRLVVNRSYPGGPLRIATYDNATGEPIPTTVALDGYRVRTGSDGVAWALTPPGPRFRVTVDGPGGRVSVRVRPLAPVPLNETT